MFGKINNKHITKGDIVYGDVVEILSGDEKILGDPLKNTLNLKKGEVLVKKIKEIGKDREIFIKKCFISDIKILNK